MKISILGSGQVGSRIGKEFANSHEVIFYDTSQQVLEKLKSEGYPIANSIQEALEDSDISFIAVPTPLKDDENFDYSYIEQVGKECAKFINRFHVFVLKSTVQPGTTRNILIPALESQGKKLNQDFGVIYNPEFLTVIENTWTADQKFTITPKSEGRIILGESSDKRAGNIIQELYKDHGVPIFRTNFETAEAKKLFANSRLPLVTSFANEMAQFFSEVNQHLPDGQKIDTDFVIKKTALDPRIGTYGSVYGKAFGGPCFKKDPNAFRAFFQSNLGKAPSLLNDTIEINKKTAEKFGHRE